MSALVRSKLFHRNAHVYRHRVAYYVAVVVTVSLVLQIVLVWGRR